MATCRYCLAELQEGARKCRHCGEWVGEAPRSGSGVDELAHTANRYLKLAPKVYVIASLISLVLFAVFALLAWRWFDSERESMQRDHEQRVREMREIQPLQPR